MVDKYLFFDNPVFRNSEIERPISDIKLQHQQCVQVTLHFSINRQHLTSAVCTGDGV